MVLAGYRTPVRALLIASGLLLLFNRSVPIVNLIFLALALCTIQLSRQRPGAWLGWLGTGLVVIMPLLPPVLQPRVGASLGLLSLNPRSFLVSFLFTLPMMLGVVMVGISMRNSGFYSKGSGTLFALSPILGAIVGFQFATALALILLGVFYPKVGETDLDATDAGKDDAC